MNAGLVKCKMPPSKHIAATSILLTIHLEPPRSRDFVCLEFLVRNRSIFSILAVQTICLYLMTEPVLKGDHIKKVDDNKGEE